MSAPLLFSLLKAFDSIAPSDLPPHHRMVLLVLAGFADDDGKAWPSADTIACRTGQSRSTVQICLAELEASGWIQGERRRKGERHDSTIYTVMETGTAVTRKFVGRKSADDGPRGIPSGAGHTARGAGHTARGAYHQGRAIQPEGQHLIARGAGQPIARGATSDSPRGGLDPTSDPTRIDPTSDRTTRALDEDRIESEAAPLLASVWPTDAEAPEPFDYAAAVRRASEREDDLSPWERSFIRKAERAIVGGRLSAPQRETIRGISDALDEKDRAADAAAPRTFYASDLGETQTRHPGITLGPSTGRKPKPVKTLDEFIADADQEGALP